MLKKYFLFLFILVSFFAKAQNDVLFKKATEAYNKGEYSQAIDLYGEILKTGQHSAALYFNLGNAYYKLNEIAESIYYYEKALLLNANDQEIKTNLGYAQNMSLDAIDTLPETGLSKLYKNITSKLSFDQWAYLSIVFIILFVILYIAFYYFDYSSRKRWAFISSILFLCLSIISIVFAYVQEQDYKNYRPAIIFADEIGIQSEPNNTSPTVFTLHAGTKVIVLEDLNNWKKIQLADGKTGWIQNNKLKLLKDF